VVVTEEAFNGKIIEIEGDLSISKVCTKTKKLLGAILKYYRST
jgi:hypothetical protein